MRLVGDLASAGHVDIYHNGHWGSVCDDGLDLDEAQFTISTLTSTSTINVMRIWRVW